MESNVIGSCHPDDKITLSTGVLTREPLTVSAVVNIVNLDPNTSRKITVQVWDWSSFDAPIQLPVLIGNNVPVVFPYTLDPNHLSVMYADLNAANVSLYEIRITHSDDRDVIANCFGRSAAPYTSQEGNTVLQHQLIEVPLR